MTALETLLHRAGLAALYPGDNSANYMQSLAIVAAGNAAGANVDDASRIASLEAAAALLLESRRIARVDGHTVPSLAEAIRRLRTESDRRHNAERPLVLMRYVDGGNVFHVATLGIMSETPHVDEATRYTYNETRTAKVALAANGAVGWCTVRADDHKERPTT